MHPRWQVINDTHVLKLGDAVLARLWRDEYGQWKAVLGNGRVVRHAALHRVRATTLRLACSAQ